MPTTRKVIVDRLEGDVAILKTDDGQEVRWRSADLPFGAKEGSTIALSLRSEDDAKDDEREQTRKLLNEILQSE
ncbi:MAG: DUF3006 family protein [Patescibacteria group bacterium]|jgi:hypothetical protein